MKAIMTVTRTVGKNTGSVSPSADNTKGKKTASELGPQALAGSTQQPVSFERHPPKENTSHHVPWPSSAPSPGSHALFFLRVLFSGQPHPHGCHQLPAVRRGLVPHPSSSLMFQPKCCPSLGFSQGNPTVCRP